MQLIEKAQDIARKKLSDKRYNHVLRVKDMAKKISMLYTNDEEVITTCMLAGILHDLCKEMSLEELINLTKDDKRYKEFFKSNACLHGLAASVYIKNNIEEFSILKKYLTNDFYNSLIYHTVGRMNMSFIEKVIYVADSIEDGRQYEGVDKIRSVVFNDKKLDKAIYIIINSTLKKLIDNNLEIHINTILMRNEYINKGLIL